MIIFFEHGRLGNNIFQYAALRQLYPKHRLVCFGCGDLKKIIYPIDVISLEKGIIPSWVLLVLRKTLSLFAKIKLIGIVYESYSGSDYSVVESKGLIPNFYFSNNSSFQSKKIIDKFWPDYKIHSNFLDLAKVWLEGHKIQLEETNLVFVHVRRGDYVSWPSREYPGVLGKDWYLNAMQKIRNFVSDPLFVFISDDFHYVNDCFGDQPNVVISDNDLFVDLALMSLSKYGILSASSFAWWGGWFSKKQNNDTGIYIGPKFWIGHRIQKWLPEDFTSDWITYI